MLGAIEDAALQGWAYNEPINNIYRLTFTHHSLTGKEKLK